MLNFLRFSKYIWIIILLTLIQNNLSLWNFEFLCSTFEKPCECWEKSILTWNWLKICIWKSKKINAIWNIFSWCPYFPTNWTTQNFNYSNWFSFWYINWWEVNCKIEYTWTSFENNWKCYLIDGSHCEDEKFEPSWIVSFSTKECTNKSIIVQWSCDYDKWKWCRKNKSIWKWIEININQTWYIWIIDLVWNTNLSQYTINYIDNSSPFDIISYWKNQIAGENFLILSAKDNSPIWCKKKLLSYIYNITWPINKKISWEISDDWKIKKIILNLEKIWKYKIWWEIKDSAWNLSIIPNIEIEIFPNTPDITKSSIKLIWKYNSKYWNSNDKYEYILKLIDRYSNPIYWKSIDDIQQLDNKWNSSLMTRETNLKDILWEDAIIEQFEWKTNENWEIKFSIKSYTPWRFIENFKITLNNWSIKYDDDKYDKIYFNLSTKETNNFLYPINYDINFNYIKENETQQINIKLLINKDWFNWQDIKYDIDWWKIEKIKSKIKLSNDELFNIEQIWKIIYEWEDLLIPINLKKLDLQNMEKLPIFKFDPCLIIEYNIEWKEIKYCIYPNNFNDNSSRKYYEKFLWIKLLWINDISRWMHYTYFYPWIFNINIEENFNKIRNNLLFNLDKFRHYWKQNIKFIEWDYILENSDIYNIYVIYNWNLIIKNNFNLDKKTINIITIKDSIELEDLWNVYIYPNVNYINFWAFIDWQLVSVDNNGNIFTYDSKKRFDSLKNQLILEWMLLSRNTIYWANPNIESNYLLPWENNFTNDFNESTLYDISFLRTWNIWCDKNWNWNCLDNWEYENEVILVYNEIYNKIKPVFLR